MSHKGHTEAHESCQTQAQQARRTPSEAHEVRGAVRKRGLPTHVWVRVSMHFCCTAFRTVHVALMCSFINSLVHSLVGVSGAPPRVQVWSVSRELLRVSSVSWIWSVSPALQNRLCSYLRWVQSMLGEKKRAVRSTSYKQQVETLKTYNRKYPSLNSS